MSRRTYVVYKADASDPVTIKAACLGKAVVKAYKAFDTCAVAEQGSRDFARLWAPERPGQGRPRITCPELTDEDLQAIDDDSWVRYAFVEGLLELALTDLGTGHGTLMNYDNTIRRAVFTLRPGDGWEWTFHIPCGPRQYELALEDPDPFRAVYRLGRPQGLTRRRIR